MKFENKVVLITGSGTGIGMTVAKKFVENGASVIILGRRKEPLESTSKMLEEITPEELNPGDVLITNDPYKTAGQLLDVTVLVPVWKEQKGKESPVPIAFFGSTIHHTDVGGYGIGAGAAAAKIVNQINKR